MQFIRRIILILSFIVNFSYQPADAQNEQLPGKSLNVKQKSIVPIAAFTANGDQSSLKSALVQGLDVGLTVNEIKEILVQLYAYTGFPRSLNAINTFQAVLIERKQKGISDAVGKMPDKQVFRKGKFSFGKDVQTRLTGSAATGSAQTFVPVIDTFLKEHLFADIFSRNNLDYQSREIATISALAALGGVEGQLHSHISVGRNVGLSEQQLSGIASVLTAKVGQQEGSAVKKILDGMFGAKASSVTDPQKDPFSKGEKIISSNFTGEVWVNMLLQEDSAFNLTIGNVTFSPGSRSNWHSHPSGQILLITDGLGYYQEKGHPIRLIRKGDAIRCAPNVVHWHGASRDSSMSHIALSPTMQKGNVKWLEKVTDEEYGRLN